MPFCLSAAAGKEPVSTSVRTSCVCKPEFRPTTSPPISKRRGFDNQKDVSHTHMTVRELRWLRHDWRFQYCLESFYCYLELQSGVERPICFDLGLIVIELIRRDGDRRRTWRCFIGTGSASGHGRGTSIGERLALMTALFGSRSGYVAFGWSCWSGTKWCREGTYPAAFKRLWGGRW